MSPRALHRDSNSSALAAEQGELGRYGGPRNAEEVLAGGDPPRQAKVVECLRQGQRGKVVREGGLLGNGDQGVQPHQVVIDGLDLRVRREPRVGEVPGPLIVLLVHAEPRRWLPAQHAEELGGAEFCSRRHVDGPGEVIARDLQLDRLGRLRLDAALHDGGGPERREEGADELLDGGHGSADVGHSVDAQRDVVGDLRYGVAAVAEPDGPVVMLPGRHATQDLLGIQAVMSPKLLPDPLPAWPAAVCCCVTVGGSAQQTQHVVRQRIKKTGHAFIEPPRTAAGTAPYRTMAWVVRRDI